MIGPYAGLLLGVLIAVFFYRAADYEQIHPWAWTAASLGITALAASGNHGVGLLLLGQAVLFAAMWWYNIQRAKPR